MRYSLLSSIFLASHSLLRSTAAPVSRRQEEIDDITVLNYALTFKHLENAFYHQALDRFDDQAFWDAGLSSWTRARFQQIADHEATHVQFLSTALGKHATQPCTYNFPYTDPQSFVALSQVLEGVGVAAYTGALQHISDTSYLTAAASMLSTEARHASWVASAVNGQGGWSSAFDVPLNFDEGYSLAAAYIVSCPSANSVIPTKVYPALKIHEPVPGKYSYVEIAHGAQEASYIAFLTGLGVVNVPTKDGLVKIPGHISGEVYAVATSSAKENSRFSDMVAGPAILSFEQNSQNELVSAKQAN